MSSQRPAGSRTALRLAALAAVIGLCLRLLVVPAPFYADDLSQMAFLADDGPSMFSFASDLDLFRFIDGDADAARAKMDAGVLPWRADPEQRAAFFRPVSSIFMVLDHELFGVSPLPCHLHSLLWFAAYVFVIWRLYQVVLTPGTAVVATLLTILSPVGILTVKWWAGRYALVTAFFAACGILHHLRWLRDGRRHNLGLSLLFFACSLLAGESGVMALAFAGAYTVVQARGAVGRIARQMAPCTLLFVAYMLVRSQLGYGVERSALYVDPLVEPAGYLTALVTRFHMALGGAFFNLVGESDTPPPPAIELLTAAFALLAAAILGGRRLGRDPATARTTWALLLGSLLALTLCFASRSALRPWTYMVPQIGLCGVLATLITALWSRERDNSALPRVTALLLVAVCAAAAARTYWESFSHTRALRRDRSHQALQHRMPDEVRRAIAAQANRIVFLRSPEQVIPASFLRVWYGVGGGDRDLETITLSDTAAAQGGCVVTRTGASTLLLESLELEEPLLRANDIYRYDGVAPFRAGQTISLAGMTVAIRDVREWRSPSGHPVLDRVYAAEFAFERALDDPGTVFLAWEKGRFRLVELPAVGEKLILR